MAIDDYMNTNDLDLPTLKHLIATRQSSDASPFIYMPIAAALKTRPLCAISPHVKRIYSDINNLGPLTPEEDKLLMQSVLEHGHDWQKASAATGRAATTCRDRWRNHLNFAELKVKARWTTELDNQMDAAIRRCGGGNNWTSIAAEMKQVKGRDAIRERWFVALSFFFPIGSRTSCKC